jgi:hypothetical protein
MPCRRLVLAFGAVLSTAVIGAAGHCTIGEGQGPVVDRLSTTVSGLTTAGSGS